MESVLYAQYVQYIVAIPVPTMDRFSDLSATRETAKILCTIIV
jgi:hypothetical protein